MKAIPHVSSSTSELRVRLVAKIMFMPSSNFLTGRCKVVLLLWILFLICVSCLSLSVSYCLVCSLQPCDHLLGKGWPLGFLVYDVFLCFVTLPYGVLGQVWYLILSIPELCVLPYLDPNTDSAEPRDFHSLS